MSDETTGKRGRIALTPEQKELRKSVIELAHGLGEHSISTSIHVTSRERAILRSFAKSLNKPFFGTNELLATVLRRVLLGYNVAPVDAPDFSQEIISAAAQYDAENESPEILSCKKEIQKYEKVAEGYRSQNQKIPAAITGIIKFHRDSLAELIPDYATPEETNDDEE